MCLAIYFFHFSSLSNLVLLWYVTMYKHV
jgi:hypothetical protein